MLLTCPTCARSYTVGRVDLGEAGRIVICPGCETQWFAGGIASPPAASNDDRRGPRIIDTPVSTMRTPRQLAAGPSFIERQLVPWMRRVAVAGAIMVVTTMSITQRDRIVRHAPRMAVLYGVLGLDVNRAGLAFDGLAPRRLASSDVTVAGGIRNVARRRLSVPRIAFEVRDAAGSPLLSWSEAPPARTLDPGATLAFASAPHHMPADGAVVSVRFASDGRGWTVPAGSVASSR